MLLSGIGLYLSLAVSTPHLERKDDFFAAPGWAHIPGVENTRLSGLRPSVLRTQESNAKIRKNYTQVLRRCDIKRAFMVCIDPGHSKKTVGAAANGLKEYVVCWQMAKLLEAALKRKGDRVVLTKTNQDENVSNEERARIANREEADLFIRLHCDTAKESGIATFYPATQGHIRDKTGPDTEVIAQSRRCARAFHAALLTALAAQHSPLRDRGVRTDAQTHVGGKLGGALEGSIYSTRPVLLVEMCVLNASVDARFIRAKENQKLLADAMAKGVHSAIAANHKNEDN